MSSFASVMIMAQSSALPPPLVCRPGEMASDVLYVANFTSLDGAATWCRNSTRCAGFSVKLPYPASCNGEHGTVEAHFADGWGARRPNHNVAWSNFLVPGPRPPAPRPPYTPPPNPCLPGGEASPKYHIMNMGVPAPHDVNSLFKYKGLWHVMHQANWTDWAHLVSSDMTHWTRLQSALSPNGDWDGAVTIVDGKPIIMFDCYNVADCRPPAGNATSGPLGDPAIVGVARPHDYGDPELKEWDKDPSNPVAIHGAGQYAGPSTLWQDGKETRMLMPNNGAISLFSTADSSLHSWNITTASFYPNSSGPSEFFALPGADLKERRVTHVLGGIAPPKPHLAGTAWYVLGRYDPVAGALSNTTSPAPLDGSEFVVFSQLHVDGERMLFMGWFNPCDSSTCHGSLTAPREVIFDADAVSLRSLPVSELVALRGKSIGERAPTTMAAGEALALFDEGSDAYDLLLNVSLPQSGAVNFALAIFGSSEEDACVTLQLNVSAPSAAGARDVFLASNAAGFASMQFQIPAVVAMVGTITVRVLADRTLAEVFVADGRGVVTVPVSTHGNSTRTGAFIVAGTSGLAGVSAKAWEMGCGWAKYP